MPPPFDRRTLPDLLQDAEFLLVQLVVLHRTGGPHSALQRGKRIAELHRKLDAVEYLLRSHAAQLGLDTTITLGQLRRELARLVGKANGISEI